MADNVIDMLSALYNQQKEILRILRKQEADIEKPVYSCTEAATLLNRDRSTISRYLKEGKLRKVRKNGRYGIPYSDIQRMMKK